MTTYFGVTMFKGKVPPVAIATTTRVEKNILREEVLKEVAEEMAAMRSVISSQRQIIDSQHVTIAALERRARPKDPEPLDSRIERLNLEVRRLKRIVKEQKARLEEVRGNLRAFFGDPADGTDPSDNISFH